MNHAAAASCASFQRLSSSWQRSFRRLPPYCPACARPVLPTACSAFSSACPPPVVHARRRHLLLARPAACGPRLPRPGRLSPALLRHRRLSQSSSSSGSGWRLSAESVVWLLIGCNAAVFVLWQSAFAARDVRRLRWLEAHFTVSLQSLRSGRLHCLITSAFSQAELSHLLVNCFSLFAFGLPLCRFLGVRRFLTVYAGGAVASSLAHIAYQNLALPRIRHSGRSGSRSRGDLPAMGASGSAMACTVLFACLFPHSSFLLYLVVPLPAWLCAAGLVAYDALQGWKADPADRTAHAGHLGGAAFGLLYWLAFRRRGLGGARAGGRTVKLGMAASRDEQRGWRGRPL